MITSLLETDYINPERPYSQKELQYTRQNVMRSLRVGKVRAHHKKCDHFYYVKENGRKEIEIKEANSGDVANCSVCWKFNRTPQNLKDTARCLINSYCAKFFEQPTYLTYDNIDLETVFYKWLYQDIN